MMVMPRLQLFAGSGENTREVLDIADVDYQLASTTAPLEDQWRHGYIAGTFFAFDSTAPWRESKALWVRIRFDRRQLTTRPLALFTNRTNQSLQLALNGRTLYQSFRNVEEWQYGWNRPRLVSLPESLLNAEANEIILRISNRVNDGLRLGPASIGDSAILGKTYAWRHFWQVALRRN